MDPNIIAKVTQEQYRELREKALAVTGSGEVRRRDMESALFFAADIDPVTKRPSTKAVSLGYN